MEPPLNSPEDVERYRVGYLKLRSVLHDRVTGLPAFPVHIDQLRTMLDQRRVLGVLHIEFADLKIVESLYGWQVFDRILARAATSLQSTLGGELPAETLLSINAVAGDCFIAFVPAGPDGAEVDGAYLTKLGRTVCRRLQRAFRGKEFAGISPHLVFRAGHSLLSLDPFHRFERRVYEALASASSFNEQRERRRELSWSEELHRIIRDAEVDVVFQPVVDLGSRSFLGHEAFVRGPSGSLFETPRAMFSMSERIGADVELDRVCSQAALKGAAEIERGGKLFLNLLVASLSEGEDGPLDIQAAVAAAGREASDVVLEFSERLADSDPDGFVKTLRGLKEQGFPVALDDVGTGFYSRSLIEQIRPDYLKLDESLVRNIHKNLIKQELLVSLIRLAREFGSAVIAEGVESEEEAAVLLEAGAGYGQGYHFAAPVPPSSPLWSARHGANPPADI